MNEQVQQQIVALVQAAMQGDQQAQQQIQQIMQAAQQGDQQAIQIAQLIQQVVQQMQGQQGVQSAKFGAKLNYIKHLRGQCPAGYEMGYYKAGGRLCKKCIKKRSGGGESEVPDSIRRRIDIGQNALDDFKKQHPNYRKEVTDSTTRKKILDAANKLPNYNKKEEQPKKEKCGGKVKKNAVGGAVNSKEMPISCPCHKKKK